ncbi:MAG: hypothetical protein KF799_13860 [Bdellovibrionales bacterium]|nr:hypothetical protein [Bdellovibrionales bacterium]
MKKAAMIMFLFMPALAFAHGSTIQMASDSTKAALTKFETEETGPASSFSGVKTWLNGSDAKVRVYYNNNADSIYYTCMMHHEADGSESLMCHKD